MPIVPKRRYGAASLASAVAAVLFAAGAFVAAPSAWAAGSGQQASGETRVQNECWPRFAEFDANADKVVDADELDVGKEKIFDVLDRNGDDRLSRAEFIGCLGLEGERAVVIPEFFAELDANQDGHLTMAEFDIEGRSEWRELSILDEKPASGG